MKKNLFLITEDERERILGLHESATKKQYLNILNEGFNKTNGTYTIENPQTLKASVDFNTKFPSTIPVGTVVFHNYKGNDTKIVLGNTGVVTYCDRNTFIYNDSIDDLKNDGLMNVLKGVFCNGTKLKTWQQLTGGPSNTSNISNQNNVVGGGGQGTKIITNNDKSYDYKEENGKYYFSKKGENKWVEAKGTGLEAIKKLNWGAATPSTATTTPTTATTTPTTGTTVTLPTLPLSGMTAQSNLSNQQLATGPVRSGQEIRQDFRQQQRQERQGVRQERRDVRQMEKELKDLQATYQRLQGKMTPQDKLAYENQIKQLQTQIGQQG